MSFLNFLDARSKLIFVILLTLPVFLIDTLVMAVCLLLSFLFMRLVFVKTPLKAKHIGNFALLAVFIIILQMIFAPGNSYIVKFGSFIALKWEGLILGVIISCRLFALVLLLPVFTQTTPAHRIAEGLCSFGLNYRIAFILTAAYSMIYQIKNRAIVIMEAQALRGGRLRGIRAYALLLMPLMLGAMRKAQETSVCMDSRSFGIYKTRTWIDKSVMKKSDFLFITLTVFYSALMIFLNQIEEIKIEPYLF